MEKFEQMSEITIFGEPKDKNCLNCSNSMSCDKEDEIYLYCLIKEIEVSTEDFCDDYN